MFLFLEHLQAVFLACFLTPQRYTASIQQEKEIRALEKAKL